MLGTYWDNGREDGNYYLGLRVSGYQNAIGVDGSLAKESQALNQVFKRSCDSFRRPREAPSLLGSINPAKGADSHRNLACVT